MAGCWSVQCRTIRGTEFFLSIPQQEEAKSLPVLHLHCPCDTVSTCACAGGALVTVMFVVFCICLCLLRMCSASRLLALIIWGRPSCFPERGKDSRSVLREPAGDITLSLVREVEWNGSLCSLGVPGRAS